MICWQGPEIIVSGMDNSCVIFEKNRIFDS